MRGLFLCFALASILNALFITGGAPPTIANNVNIGYQGYFSHKNDLGESAAVAILLALYEILQSGARRALGIIILLISFILVLVSHSKTALGLAVVAPFLAGLTLICAKKTRISPALILFLLLPGYAMLHIVTHYDMSYVSYKLYGDPTFSGRTTLWDFAKLEIARKPLLGWGYQSFWLAGPDAPSIVDAFGDLSRSWIKTMPNAHNGYYDTMLQLGYVGLTFLSVFLISTIHAVKRVAVREPARAWTVLSLILFITLYNFLESLWMNGFDILWVVFVILAAEIGRFWAPYPPTKRTSRPGGPGPSTRACRSRTRCSDLVSRPVPGSDPQVSGSVAL
jgi:O-antigen ligase